MKQPDLWLVFDLGGVLVDFYGLDGLAEITGRGYEAIHASLKNSPACQLFESGRIGGSEFAVLLKDELELEMPPAELLERWVGWLGGLMPGAVEVLVEARARYHTACLSNTNELHWKDMMERQGLAGLFERTFASHEIGHRKPDPEIFAHVADALGPGRIVYFDDNAHIVDGARAFGWDAHQTVNPGEIRAAMGRLRLL